MLLLKRTALVALSERFLMTRIRFVLMLYFFMVAHGAACRTTVGVRQGCLLSATLFNIFQERIVTDALEDHEGAVSIGSRTITNLRLADNIDGLAGE
ncbi:hypothetical protein [Thiolapillus sp.]|uniref:hypothetical protein n=1 Tax=Thiolapillus sp. TaxID=2017437 RepID=UPI003AF7739F